MNHADKLLAVFRKDWEMGLSGLVELIESERTHEVVLVDKGDFSAWKHNVAHAAITKRNGGRHRGTIFGGKDAERSAFYDCEKFL